MTFIIGKVLGFAFVDDWIRSKVRNKHRLENERRDQQIKARVDARVAAIQAMADSRSGQSSTSPVSPLMLQRIRIS